MRTIIIFSHEIMGGVGGQWGLGGLLGDGVLVGGSPHGDRLRYFHGMFHPMLCHTHTLFQSTPAKEPSLHRDTQTSSEGIEATGT